MSTRLYPANADTPAMQVIDQEVLLAVYVALEKSNCWSDFIDSPMLEVFAEEELKAKHKSEYVEVYRATPPTWHVLQVCYTWHYQIHKQQQRKQLGSSTRVLQQFTTI